jgi:hypothetical protein
VDADRDMTTSAATPVLVTGMHRSGTSWLGWMLSAGGAFVNIGEPLNVSNRQTILRRAPERWYTHITDANERDYLRHYEDAVALRIRPIDDIRRMRLGSPRDPIRVPKKWASFLQGRIQHRRLLIKDPFALFSIDWFVRRLRCQVFVTVRHPVAVVSSLKRLGFTFDFNDLLQQPSLMDERLERFRPAIEALHESRDDIIGQGSLLWRVIYETIAEEHSESTNPILLRHEDLSLNPIDHCEHLYDVLGLPFTAKTRELIRASTSRTNPAEVSHRNPFTIRLDSRANLGNWRHRLQDEEVARILEITEPVVTRFYPEGLRSADPSTPGLAHRAQASL